MSVSRYQHAQETTEDPRMTEHRMLARVTGMLVEGGKTRGPGLNEACYYNFKLWSIFQTDLARPDNPLPDQIKANLISLALWVQRYTPRVLDGAPVEPLINVNRSIMEGLKPAAPAAAATPAGAAAPPAARLVL